VWDKALTYYRQAGEKALARSAHREAVGYFEQALGALPHLLETRGTREQAIDLRLAFSALYPPGDQERILAYLREAEHLAEALDDPRRLGQVSVFLYNHLQRRGAYDQAIAAVQRALALATASRDVILQGLANLRLGYAYHAQGHYRRAIDCFGQPSTALDGARRHERFGMVFLPAVDCRAYLAACHAELGTFTEGRASGEEGVRIAEAVNHPASLMCACWGIGVLSLCQGDLSGAIPRLEQAVDLCRETDLPAWFPLAAATLGEAYTLCARLADAVPLLTQALERAAATGRGDIQTRCHLSLGEAQLRAGGLGEAQALTQEAQALARAHRERGYEAYALHLLGEIAAHRHLPEVAQAEDYYRQGLGLTRELGVRPLMAHCHRGLGTLYAKTNRREQARAELSTAVALYRSMDMIFWLPQVEAALAPLSG
jgi:tetratricopeptide (TPR) repeat protein